MLRRFLSFLVLIWAFGFMWFAIALPGPLGSEATAAVVVYTGGKGRIDRGLDVLRKGWARRLLVSGVDREVRPNEFAIEYDVSPKLMKCCVTLGFQSYDTRSNARETADWLAATKFTSVRLVTTDWHMRRAALELDQVKPRGVNVVRDAVPSRPSLSILFLEYHKLLARWISLLWRK
ncbi:MAG TPA: YdcF family protein [Novosphingobium sp.]|nr:YdcF family protein [Novosphingobium sp.]